MTAKVRKRGLSMDEECTQSADVNVITCSVSDNFPTVLHGVFTERDTQRERERERESQRARRSSQQATAR